MKARPVKIVQGEGYIACSVEEATHVELNFPGPCGKIHLPFILKGTREGTGCWTWNGDTEKPTMKPSILTQGHHYEPTTNVWTKFRCHTWVNDGKAQFLDDTSHALRNTTVDMLDVDGHVAQLAEASDLKSD